MDPYAPKSRQRPREPRQPTLSRRRALGLPPTFGAGPTPTTATRHTVDRPPVDQSVGAPLPPKAQDPVDGHEPLRPDAATDLGALAAPEPVTDDEPVVDATTGAELGTGCTDACSEGHTYDPPCIMAVLDSIPDGPPTEAPPELEPEPKYSPSDVPTRADDVFAWLATAQGDDDRHARAEAILEAERIRKGKARSTVVEAATAALAGGGD